MNKSIVVASLLAFATVTGAQTAPVLTLDDAVALALKETRQVKSAGLNINRAREKTAALKTNRLPKFSAYMLGGEALRPISFTIPQGALGVYPATGPI